MSSPLEQVMEHARRELIGRVEASGQGPPPAVTPASSEPRPVPSPWRDITLAATFLASWHRDSGCQMQVVGIKAEGRAWTRATARTYLERILESRRREPTESSIP